MTTKVIIIGAGVGGTAARLSKKGFQVEVYEKNAYNGAYLSITTDIDSIKVHRCI
ncbi:Hypothetical protein CINCED_3A000612 [Cinara cedri]|uniref:FAD/NAD(P)-binding domain n=1 Tax=Cinara cedri TaxID=506608 RepID=A0A5E4N8M2_9HEMI|nr:Hypothetical protein CINCED_3A000612 [Cinara cedri]